MAASPSSGQWFSQMPQPMQSSRRTTGRCKVTISPAEVGHGDFLQADGFFRRRAHLLADDAGRGARPRQAAVAVHDCGTDDGLAFLIQTQGWNGTRWANLPAGVAADSRNDRGAASGWESTILPDRFPPGQVAGHWWGRLSCTRCSADISKGMPVHP